MYRFMRLTLAIGLVVSLVSNLHAQNRIPWVTSLVQARQMAQQHQRLILMHFWSNACPPCLKLERQVFNRPEVIRAISTNYVPLKVNVSDNESLARQYKVNRWPTDIITTANGQEVFRGVSQQDPNRYIALLDQVAAHTRVSLPIASSPSTVPTHVPGARPDQRDSAFPAPSYSPNPTAVASTQSRREYSAPAARAVTTNPYLAEPTMGPLGPPAPPQRSAVTPAYGRQVLSGNMAMPAQYAQAPPAASGATIHQPPAAPSHSARNSSPPVYVAAADRPPVPPKQPIDVSLTGPSVPAAQPERHHEAAQNAVTSDSPPLALEGYCPVTLVEQGKWVKGDAKWGAIHRGKTYLFAGEQQQKRFFGALDKYAPVLSGYDPVRYVETGALI